MGRLHPKSHFLDVHLANANSHGRAISTSATTTTTTTTTTLISATPASYFAGAPKPKNFVPLRLAPREENTRVQLQKQRLQGQHSKQLVSPPNIPGFKTSAGEFSFPRILCKNAAQARQILLLPRTLSAQVDIDDRAIYPDHDKTANATSGKIRSLEQLHNLLQLMN